ncbi:hypothetical protein M3194_15780 [Paenibacillus glycanilyticus]|uniref:hypothetical protein n=1 Tax=Paenibacillus glycanilyticus TaxID=126569 RepID=UPI00203D1F7D|nr:hypothetical protein [Paenibacillus glycanilyticus]MCM3628804.1 hypothetical protein [Paenibacillus glycanilyticus]
MREITINDQTVRLKASPLSLFYWRTEFNSDLMGDFMKMKDIEQDHSKLDFVFLLQLVWVMQKTYENVKSFPTFPKWLESMDDIDLLSNQDMFVAVMEEAQAGFFRGGTRKQQYKQNQRKTSKR